MDSHLNRYIKFNIIIPKKISKKWLENKNVYKFNDLFSFSFFSLLCIIFVRFFGDTFFGDFFRSGFFWCGIFCLFNNFFWSSFLLSFLSSYFCFWCSFFSLSYSFFRAGGFNGSLNLFQCLNCTCAWASYLLSSYLFDSFLSYFLVIFLCNNFFWYSFSLLCDFLWHFLYNYISLIIYWLIV